jgi:hypothetical protein
VLSAVAALALVACGDDGGGSTAAFCSRVAENEGRLFGDVTTLDDAQELVALYRDVGAVAPLAVEADWDALTLRLETAVESDDEQETLARAYASERSAVAVAHWLRDNCDLAITVATIVPAAPSVPGESVAPSAATS